MKSKLSIVLVVVIIVMGLFASQALSAEGPTITKEEEKFLSFMEYDNAENHVRHLSDVIGNRRVASIGTDQAVEYFVDKLKSYGYYPIVQEFDLRDAVFGSAASAANQLNHGYVEIDSKKYMYHGPAYAAATVYQFTNNTVNSTGAVVMIWENTDTDFIVGSTDVMSKAVFVKLGTGPTTTSSSAAAPNAARYYNAALALQNAGASAVIFQWREPRPIVISPLPPFDGKPTGTDTTYAAIGNTTTGTAITIPVGTTHYTDTNSILSVLKADTRVNVNMRTRFDGQNVIAILRSETGSKKTAYVVAHYDSVLSSPAGNDNGSGPALLLELARACKQGKVKFEHNIVFVLCSPEEGFTMRGSRNFIQEYIGMGDNAKEEIFKGENFLGIYNMDQIATAQPEAIFMLVSTPDPAIQALQNALPNVTDTLLDKPEALIIMNKYTTFQNIFRAVQKQHNSGRHKDKKIKFKMTGLDPTAYHTYEKDTITGAYIYDEYRLLDNFNIVFGSGTDHNCFYAAAVNGYHENLRNSMQCFSWREYRKGLNASNSMILERVYHTVGDTYANNYSRARHEIDGDTVFLSLYYSAEGSVGCTVQPGGTFVLPGGAVITLPGGATFAYDGTIIFPGDIGAITLHRGTTVRLPSDSEIDVDEILPSGGKFIVTTSNGSVSVEVYGSFIAKHDGTITLPGVDVTIVTGNGTKIILTGGSIVEEKDGLSIIAGQSGAYITYPNGTAKTAPKDSVIKVKADGSVSIKDSNIIDIGCNSVTASATVWMFAMLISLLAIFPKRRR